MPSFEPVQTEVTEAEADLLVPPAQSGRRTRGLPGRASSEAAEGSFRRGRCPEEAEEAEEAEGEEAGEEDADEAASTDGHRKLLLCMGSLGSRSAGQGNREVVEDVEYTDDFSQSSADELTTISEGSAEGRLSQHGDSFYLDDTGAGVWKWLWCEEENGDCSTAGSDEHIKASTKENGCTAEDWDLDATASQSSDTEPGSLECGACGCCKRGSASSEGDEAEGLAAEEDHEGHEVGFERPGNLSTCSLQAVETSSSSTCVPSIPDARDDSSGNFSDIFATGEGVARKVAPMIVKDEELDVSPHPSLFATGEDSLCEVGPVIVSDKLESMWPKAGPAVCTVVSFDDYVMCPPITHVSI